MDRWPRATRARAVDLYLEAERNVAETQRRLAAELGQTVPVETLRHWVRGADTADGPPTVPALSGRLLRLCSLELARLERAPASKMDLDRAGKVAQILKVVEPLVKGKGQAPRRLEDLSLRGTDGLDEPSEETVLPEHTSDGL